MKTLTEKLNESFNKNKPFRTAYVNKRGDLTMSELLPSEVSELERIVNSGFENIEFDNKYISGSYYQYFIAKTNHLSINQINNIVNFINNNSTFNIKFIY